MLLSKINTDPRDQYITFREEDHVYTLELPDKGKVRPRNVTSLIHNYFPNFDEDKVIGKIMNSMNWTKSIYYGKTSDEIKKEWEKTRTEASINGKNMHADIERYLNQEQMINPNCKEINLFFNFWNSFQNKFPNFQIFRTEWIIYDEDQNISGSIDCVLKNEKDEMILLDWKRSKKINFSNGFENGFEPFSELDNCNFSHYTLQLNIYRHILETKYNRVIVGMYLVILHPDQDNFKEIEVDRYPLDHCWNQL